MENEILTSENIGEAIEEQTVCSYTDFFKINILELLQLVSKLAENDNYNITLEKVETIAENLLENDELFDMLDSFILEELENISED